MDITRATSRLLKFPDRTSEGDVARAHQAAGDGATILAHKGTVPL